MSSDLTPLGELLEAAREGLRISAREASRRAGLSPTRWRQVVTGRQPKGTRTIPVNPKPRTVVAMAIAVLLDPATALRAAGLTVPPDLAALVADVQAEMRRSAESVPDHGPVVDLTRAEHERLTAEIARIEGSTLPESAKLMMLEALIRAWTRYAAERGAQRRDDTA